MYFAQTNPDLIVFSVDEWDSKSLRMSQILAKFARDRKVYYFETPTSGISKHPMYLLRETREEVMVVEPHLPGGLSIFEQEKHIREILNKLLEDENIRQFTVWTDSPKAMPYFRDVNPEAIIYDCHKDHSTSMAELEKELFHRADVVLTPSPSLLALKRHVHSNIHLIPDCVDYRHFFQGRYLNESSYAVSDIPQPRIGFAGPIDERIDLELLANLAKLRPDYQFILAGEVSEAVVDELPISENIHYLKSVNYADLPSFLSTLNCSFLPYRVNANTRFLNPTLIPESLIAGRQVVSTPLQDVVLTYNRQRLISLADFPIDFCNRIDYSLHVDRNAKLWNLLVDENFKNKSWGKCCSMIEKLEEDIHAFKTGVLVQKSLSGFLDINSYVRP